MQTSLRTPRSARTVLLRMAADEARAQRIRALKERHPELTWRYIAEACGVTERAAVAWGRTGGIAYPNVKKLATLFISAGENIDADYLWRGDLAAEAEPSVPDTNNVPQLDRIEAKLDALFGALADGATQPDALERLQAAFAALPQRAEEEPRPAPRTARRAQR